jgi:hypothetical protein
MQRATASLVLLTGLVLCGLLCGGCGRRSAVVVYHAAGRPNPNMLFGSRSPTVDFPVLPPPGCPAATAELDPSFFPGEITWYREYIRDHRRTPHGDRFDQFFYGIREGAVLR